MRINVGCGSRRLSGYTNLDIKPEREPGVVADICNLPFPNESAEEIRGDALLEHIWPKKRPFALVEWLRVLRPGGLLALNWIPDFDALMVLYGGTGPSESFPSFDIEMAKRMLYGAGEEKEPDLHKDIFTAHKIKGELELSGFTEIGITRPIAEGETLAYNLSVAARKIDVPVG